MNVPIILLNLFLYKKYIDCEITKPYKNNKHQQKFDNSNIVLMTISINLHQVLSLSRLMLTLYNLSLNQMILILKKNKGFVLSFSHLVFV